MLAALLLVAACTEHAGARRSAARADATTADAASMRRPASAAAPAAPNEWSIAEVVRRLTDAGLVVADSGQRAARAPLADSGALLHVSGGTLEVYLYADAAARERESAKLDTVTHGLPSIYNPRFIVSGNLIGVLTTPSDRTAERVTSVLEAWHTR